MALRDYFSVEIVGLWKDSTKRCERELPRAIAGCLIDSERFAESCPFRILAHAIQWAGVTADPDTLGESHEKLIAAAKSFSECSTETS